MTLLRYPNKALQKPPRALVVADRLASDLTKRDHPTAQQVEPLMGLYATGQLPIDAGGQAAIKTYLDKVYRDMQRGTPPAPAEPTTR
jgi:hypothetical protein